MMPYLVGETITITTTVSGSPTEVTATVLLSPHIAIEAKNATSKSLFVDAVWVYQARSSTP